MLVWERARHARIELTLLDAAAMRRLNRRSLGRRGLTDVIAFALPQANGSLLGDVYICPEAAERYLAGDPKGLPDNRGKGEWGAVAEEMIRLAVHGTLHVLGYDHPAGPGRTRSTMWRTQERYVRRLLRGSH
ncbi:MAG: rRNA maturation RNAse YbeY [Gemmatimonadetes bacterium]|nr:rRNA maturation RNAse YbeY [Gemmatimonadota bacterium]